jgi:hypothetical protein
VLSFGHGEQTAATPMGQLILSAITSGLLLVLAVSANAQVDNQQSPAPATNLNAPVRVPTIRCTLVCKRDLRECEHYGNCPENNCQTVCAGQTPQPSMPR